MSSETLDACHKDGCNVMYESMRKMKANEDLIARQHHKQSSLADMQEEHPVDARMALCNLVSYMIMWERIML